MSATITQLRALADRPDADRLAYQLQDIGDGLAADFLALSRDPHPAACEMLAIRLDGARRLIHLLAEALREVAK